MVASSIIIDIFIVGLIITFIIIGYIKGFTAVVLNLAAWFLALSLATVFSASLSEYCYTLVNDALINKIDCSIQDVIKLDDNVKDNVGKVMDELPTSIRNTASYLGYSDDYILNYINDKYSSQEEIKPGKVISDIIKPAVMQVLRLLVFLVLFIVLFFIFKNLAKLIDNAFQFSVIGVINRILGGATGLIKGLLIAFIIGLMIYGFIGFTDNGNEFINTDVISDTYVFKNIYSNNPFVNIVSSNRNN